jgi:hypothetical protein
MVKAPEELRVYVVKNVKRKRSSGCWIWKLRANSEGYGQAWNGKKTVAAHRLSYGAFIAPIPPGLLVCHKCDVPLCVNPDHLFLGSVKDNQQDAFNKRVSPRKNSKLSVDDVRAIFSDQRTMDEIASDYQITRTNVIHIKKRRTWKWLNLQP